MPPANAFSRVQVLVAIDNPVLRKGLSEALKRMGFGEVTVAATYVQAHAALGEGKYDLIVAVSEMEGFFIGQLIDEIRHSRLGSNPFPVVMMLLPSSEHDHVRRVIDSGPDDMLLVPVRPDQLLARVQGLARARKPFVVTHDYIGPDRRKQGRTAGEVIPLVEVPNPIKAKADGINASSFQRDIEDVTRRLNTMKVERYGVQIRWLDRTIRELCAAETVKKTEVSNHAQHLMDVAEDLRVRTASWPNERIGKSAQLLAAAAKAVAGGQVDAKQIELIAQACSQTAQEIARSLPHLDSGAV